MFLKFKIKRLIVVSLFAYAHSYATEINAETLRLKSLKATRTDKAPVVDGVIDDLVWSNAQLLDDFIQYEPYNLVPASVKTQVRVLYDDNNIYIAFENFDPDPDGIMTRMSRRDDYEQIDKNTDWVGFGFDSNDDDLTGNWFMLTAAGVQLDVSINETRGFRSAYDISWNAVWDGETSIHSEGWSAEIRIPFNVFQFSKNSEQVWCHISERLFRQTRANSLAWKIQRSSRYRAILWSNFGQKTYPNLRILKLCLISWQGKLKAKI